MANTTSSANMNLPVPGVGIDPGPQWATDLNSCLTIIDAHNHSSGSGVRITPDGINISSDLPMSGNNLTLTRTVRFQSQPSTLALSSDKACIYTTGVDLYYNDGNGNVVRITQSGNLAGSPGSIAGLASPASATYVSANQTFVWQAGANVAANMDLASLILRNSSLNSNGLTLQPPAAMASNYTLTLPSIPGQTNVMSLDASGNMGSITYDAVGQAMTSVGANAIGVSMNSSSAANNIAALRTRTGGYTGLSTAGIGGVATSASFSVSGTTTITGATTISITTSGRPIYVGLASSNTGGTAGRLQITANSAADYDVEFYVEVSSNGGSSWSNANISLKCFATLAAAQKMSWPAQGLCGLYMTASAPPVAGTYLFRITGASFLATPTTYGAFAVRLFAYEI